MMKKTTKRPIAIILSAVIALGFCSIGAQAADAEIDFDNGGTVGNITSALLSAVPGDTITVIGSTSPTTSLTLNIPDGVTVNWNAQFLGTVSNRYLVTLSGKGTFNLNSPGAIRNSASGALTVTGDGMKVNFNGGALHTSGTGITLNIAADGVALRIGSNSAINNNGTNSAINVAANKAGVTIVIDSSAVVSDPNGNAINDSGADTRIEVKNGALVKANTACAIRSNGTGSTALITDSTVMNAATSSANPTIYMTAAGADSVRVNGNGIVQNTGGSVTSYAIQTAGDVTVENEAQVVAAGRAINLVGKDSVATIKGGAVLALGSGTAICTATTPGVDVDNSSVIVTGGVVSATTGYAIRITGDSSKVNVSGGMVLATSGDAIYADSSARNSEVIVGGGSVSATTGYAIRNNGAASSVIVSDTTDGTGIFGGGPGGQVTVATASPAIRSSGTVTQNGGLIFAYGASAMSAVSAPKFNGPGTVPGAKGVIGVWNQAANRTLYNQGLVRPNTLDLSFTVGTDALFWFYNPERGSGISYRNSTTSGFLPLAQVTVTNNSGLIFDAATGHMFWDTDGTGTLDNNKSQFTTGEGTMWIGTQGTQGAPGVPGVPGVLELNGFSWTTTAKTSLTIIGDTDIVLDGNSRFESTYTSGTGTGIRAVGDISINTQPGSGSSVLVAKGSSAAGSFGLDIGYRRLTICGGTLIAQGDQAIKFIGPDDAAGPEAEPEYYRWAFSNDYDGSDTSSSGMNTTGLSHTVPFKYFAADKYVTFQSMQPVGYSAVQKGGVSKVADSNAIVFTFDEPVLGLTLSDITVTNATGIVTTGALSGSGKTWTLALTGVSAEGAVTVGVKHFGDFFVKTEEQQVDVYMAVLYELEVVAGAGGTTLGAGSGMYLEGTEISVSAIANRDYRFEKWEIIGETLFDDEANPAVFYMPVNKVTLTAKFVTDTSANDVQPYGLIFSASSGRLYYDDSGTLKDAPGEGVTWTGVAGGVEGPGILSLYGFRWITDDETALTIINGDAKIFVYGENVFESEADTGNSSCGIRVEDNNSIYIEGSGTLMAKGSQDDTADTYGLDIGGGLLEIDGGTFIAVGNQAIKWDGGRSLAGGPVGEYYCWEFKGYEGGVEKSLTGFNKKSEFQYYTSDFYVMFKALEPLHFDAMQVDGEKDMKDSSGIVLTFIDPNTGLPADVANLPNDSIETVNDTGVVVDAGTRTQAANRWTVKLDSVVEQGVVNVKVEHFDDFYVEPEIQEVEVFRAHRFSLTVSAGEGGTVSGTASGQYQKGESVTVTATPISGYQFTGWSVGGVSLQGGNASNPAEFDMPDNAVTLEANFSPTPGVRSSYGLVFNSAIGELYIDNPAKEEAPGKGETWTAVPRVLTLNDFHWSTADPVALTIINGNATFVLSGDNSFESTSEVGTGISTSNNSITISTPTVGGSGTLTARGSESAGSCGIDLGSGRLTISGGTLIAQGGHAIGFTGEDGSVGPYSSSAGYRWEYDQNYNSENEKTSGLSGTDPFRYYSTDQYVMLQALVRDTTTDPAPGSQDGGRQRPPPEGVEPDEPEPDDTGHGKVYGRLYTLDHIQYVRGVGEGLFQPERGITRAEAAQLFFNLLANQDVRTINRFPDVISGAWYERAVIVLASISIIEGYPDGGYHPGDNITRAEFVAIVVRFAEQMPETSRAVPFGDVHETYWAYKYIDAASQYKWITGYPDGSFQPTRRISRAEAVTIVNRVLDRVGDRAYINSHPALERFSDAKENHWAFYDIMEAYHAHDYIRTGGIEKWIR